LLNRYNYGKRHQTIAKVWWPSSEQYEYFSKKSERVEQYYNNVQVSDWQERCQ